MIYPIQPVPKPRMTQRDKWQKRACVLQYRAFKDKCRVYRVKLPQPCRVVFWLAMPKGWNNLKRLCFEGQPHTVRPDLDNLVKALGDAVHAEDSHLWSIAAEKRWTRGKPHIEITAPRTCRVCRCTEDDCSQCVEKTGEPCYWVAPGLCSACQHDRFGDGALARAARVAQSRRRGKDVPSIERRTTMAPRIPRAKPARAARSARTAAPKKGKPRSAASAKVKGAGKGAAKAKARPRKPRSVAPSAES